MFTWSLKCRREAGEDPFTICESTIPLIINEPSNILRMRQARQLAHWTNTNEDFVMKEVLRLMDKEDARLIISRVLLEVLGRLKMNYPEPTPRRRKELKAIRRLLAK